jgi:hypothetical protein
MLLDILLVHKLRRECTFSEPSKLRIGGRQCTRMRNDASFVVTGSTEVFH